LQHRVDDRPRLIEEAGASGIAQFGATAFQLRYRIVESALRRVEPPSRHVRARQQNLGAGNVEEILRLTISIDRGAKRGDGRIRARMDPYGTIDQGDARGIQPPDGAISDL